MKKIIFIGTMALASATAFAADPQITVSREMETFLRCQPTAHIADWDVQVDVQKARLGSFMSAKVKESLFTGGRETEIPEVRSLTTQQVGANMIYESVNDRDPKFELTIDTSKEVDRNGTYSAILDFAGQRREMNCRYFAILF